MHLQSLFRRSLSVSALLAAVTASSLALAAEPAQSIVLSLDEAVERALATDPRIEERLHLVNKARALLQRAEGSDDLIFDVNAFVGLTTQVAGGFFEPGTGTPRSDKYEYNGLTSWTSLQFSIIKPLYTFGKIEHFSAAAKGNIAVKKEDVRLQRAETTLDVTRAYYGYLTARDTRYLFEDVEGRLQKSQDLVERWIDEARGDVRQADLYALQSGMAVVRRYHATAESVEAIALAGLKMLVGINRDVALELADSRIRPVDLPLDTLEALQQMALERRPEMSQLAAGLQARRSLVAAHRAGKLPNIYAGIAGMAAHSPKREKLENPYVYDPFNDYGATPLVGVKWNWATGVQAAEVAEANAALAALTARASFAQQGIPFQVAEQFHHVQGHYKAVTELKEGSRAARRWMVSRYVDFEAGFEEAEAVLTAFQGYVLIYSDYLMAVNHYNMHVARLRHVTGDYL
ncbi:MAG: TolC family protein [Thiotrichaceae bacterium]|nr:TolC family protein [Thiotrichaceae bacterium]PCI14763.1 MAG: hypothetical protein COB71_01480 [Thiotrichales bacterium]